MVGPTSEVGNRMKETVRYWSNPGHFEPVGYRIYCLAWLSLMIAVWLTLGLDIAGCSGLFIE